LPSDDVRNRVDEFERIRSLEKIKQSPLDFNPYALSLRDFLRSDYQVIQLQMVDGDELTRLIKVYQPLQKTDCLSGQYIVLKFERFLTLNILKVFGTLILPNKTLYRVLVACEANKLLKAETNL